MLSKSKIKLFTSLQQKKFRDELNLFVAEGEKLIQDLSKSLICKYLIADAIFLSKTTIKAKETIEINDHSELKKISSLTTPSQSIAVFEKPTPKTISDIDLHSNIILVLDTIQDTGNMGTILRIADWFGIDNIIISTNSADIYNAKTVQASMGAIANVNVLYIDLLSFFNGIKKNKIPIYGTFLEGNNIYTQQLTTNGIIILGNEGKGISTQLEPYINHRITIPNFSTQKQHSNSLNVAIAAAIISSEFKRGH